jgi:glycerol-3-phosphate acyltransferase PlsX
MNKVRLAIDVESGDYGPQVIISGILEARRLSDPFDAFLCGDTGNIERILAESSVPKEILSTFTIINCPDKVSLDNKRSGAWKKHADSSIIKCVQLQKEGRADASVSAGDTAVLMGAALFLLGRSEGAARPALAAFLPTIRKKPVLLLDVGANLNCRAEHLVSFALLGYDYVSRFYDIETPAVGLLNIGKEPMKGTRVICEAGEILKKKCKGYAGFIEGNDLLSGIADVVVCDGFAGNVLLKTCESVYALTASVLESNADLLKKVKNQMTILDPENYGAVPFLGIRGTVLKAHGGSSPRAISNAILTAITAVQRGAVWTKNGRPKGN